MDSPSFITSYEDGKEPSTILSFTRCTTYGEVFDVPDVMQDTNPIALYDIAGCPEDYGFTAEEYLEQFTGKMAFWMYFHPSPDNKPCFKDYHNPEALYEMAKDAGATGVVMLAYTANRTPGVWANEFDSNHFQRKTNAEWDESYSTIPFVECSATSYAELKAFQDAFYNPADGLQLNMTWQVEPNLWTESMESAAYKFLMRAWLPILYLFIVLQGLRAIYLRATGKRTRRMHLVNVPMLALSIEVICTFTLMLYFAMDGMWASNSLFKPARRFFLGLMAFISVATSIFVALNYGDIRSQSKRMANAQKTFVERNYRVLLGVGFVVLLLEFILAYIRNSASPAVYMSMNALCLVIGLFFAGYFAYEAHCFGKLLATQSSSPNTQASGSTSDKYFTKLILWSYIASVSSIVFLMTGLLANFLPAVLWTPTGWILIWQLGAISRGISTIAKIIILTPKQKRKDELLEQSTVQMTDDKGSFVGTTFTSSPAMEDKL